jgi:hypothetical protein
LQRDSSIRSRAAAAGGESHLRLRLMFGAIRLIIATLALALVVIALDRRVKK